MKMKKRSITFENFKNIPSQSNKGIKKAKAALDISHGKKSTKKICINCGNEFDAGSNNAKYCDECKNGKIYMPGHEKEHYGELIVDAVYRYKDKQYAECTCSCGKKCEMRYDSLKGGRTTSCGHVNEKNLFKQYDLTGKVNQYGVKALCQTGEKNGTSYVWHCICSCGKEFDVSAEDFKVRKSCGHAQDEARKNNVKAAKEEFDKYTIDGTNAIIITQKKPRNNKSGIKGVRWDNDRKKWIAAITFKGKKYYLGRYSTVEEAGEVRKIAEEHIFKDFLNWFSKEFPVLYTRISTKSELNEEK